MHITLPLRTPPQHPPPMAAFPKPAGCASLFLPDAALQTPLGPKLRPSNPTRFVPVPAPFAASRLSNSLLTPGPAVPDTPAPSSSPYSLFLLLLTTPKSPLSPGQLPSSPRPVWSGLQSCNSVSWFPTQNLRVRSSGGTEFFTRSATKFKGALAQKFMFVDGDRAVCGSYR